MSNSSESNDILTSNEEEEAETKVEQSSGEKTLIEAEDLSNGPSIVVSNEQENSQPDENKSESNEEEQKSYNINALDLANDNVSNELSKPSKSPSDQMITSTHSINSSNELTQSKTDLSTTPSSSHLAYEQEINRLRELITQKEAENCGLELKLTEYEQQTKQQIELMHQNFNQKLEQTLKKFQEGQKDKTSSLVMKYAESEKRFIELNQKINLLQSKLNDANKEKENLNQKINKSKLEFDKLNTDYETKLKEIMQLKKDNDKLKEQMIVNDAKQKAANLKYQSEVEAHMATKRLLEQANLELSEIRKKVDSAIPSDSETPVIRAQTPVEQDPKSSENETPAVESNTTTTAQTPAATNQNLSVKNVEKDKLTRELYALKSQLKDMFEERTTLRDKLQCMEQERKLQEISFNKYKETLQSQKQMNKDLLNEVLQLREVQETLTKEQSAKNELEQKCKIFKVELSDLQAEMSISQEKQDELLDFTSKLTEKNTRLQSENTTLTEKLEHVEAELDKKTKLIDQLNESTRTELDSIKKQLEEQITSNKSLAEDLNKFKKQVDELTVKLSDEQDENMSLKKKNAANIKDLTRQLQQLQKKLTSTSANAQATANNKTDTNSDNIPNESNNKCSRTSSISSLNDKDSIEHHASLYKLNSFPISNTKINNSYEEADTRSLIDLGGGTNYPASSNSLSSNNSNSRYNNEVVCGNDDVYVVDVDKQKIIEKIVKLQKTLAKRNEKIDFLQEHVNQLTLDLQRKTKIIQAYAMSEDVGAFTSEAQDAIKREMSRKTGIMSTLYSQNKSYLQTANLINSSQSHMTMELCLEINRKLQALLEDTLIKNLTLKESIETLGQEIARLSKENRQIRLNQ